MNWKGVTIEKFIKVMDIVESEKDEMKVSSELVELFFNKKANEISKKVFASYVEELSFLNDKPERVPMKKKYVIDGQVFKTVYKLDNLSTAQFMDYQTLCKKKLTNKDIPEIIAILLVPEGKKYNEGYDIDEVKELISKHMTIEEGLGIADFFTQSFKKQLGHLVDYLAEMMAKEPNLTIKERLKMVIQMKKLRNQLVDLLDTVF